MALADINDPDTAAHLTLSAVRSIAAGRFPEWFANWWLNAGVLGGGVDRRWLEDMGARLQSALACGRAASDYRLQRLGCDLARRGDAGANSAASSFFAAWVADLRRRIIDGSYGMKPECMADVLAAISDPAATAYLAESLKEAPTLH